MSCVLGMKDSRPSVPISSQGSNANPPHRLTLIYDIHVALPCVIILLFLSLHYHSPFRLVDDESNTFRRSKVDKRRQVLHD